MVWLWQLPAERWIAGIGWATWTVLPHKLRRFSTQFEWRRRTVRKCTTTWLRRAPAAQGKFCFMKNAIFYIFCFSSKYFGVQFVLKPSAIQALWKYDGLVGDSTWGSPGPHYNAGPCAAEHIPLGASTIWRPSWLHYFQYHFLLTPLVYPLLFNRFGISDCQFPTGLNLKIWQ